MTETCTVKKVKRGVAYIELKRKDECNGCKICSFNNKKSMTVPALCDVEVCVGDTVTVEMPTQSVGGGALMIYALPILTMLVGALIGLAGGMWLQIGLCAGGLALGLVGAFLIDRAYRRKAGVMPKVLKISNGADGSADNVKSPEIEQTDKIPSDNKTDENN